METDNYNDIIEKKTKKPRKASQIKVLEKQILDQSLVIQKEKNIYKQLVVEYERLKDNE